jgi:predicted Zn finger-like uncharacterized protein
LIVTCEQCATQFQLDDARVPAGGVRVRCSRCKHAFFIEPPSAGGDLDPVDRAARDALDAEAPPAPEATADLPDQDDPAGGFLDDGESDWEFNQTPAAAGGTPGETGEPDAAGAAIDDLLGSRHAAPAAPQARSGAGTLPDAEEEELGSPESWDFLAGDAKGATQEGLAADPLGDPPVQPATRPVPKTSPQGFETWIAPARPSLALLLISRTGQTIGWVVTIALLALIATLTLGESLSREAQPAPGFQRLASLQAEGISGRWVENLVAGPLFVVSGRLGNPTGEAIPLGVLAGVRLLDASGSRLGAEMAPLGPAIPQRELREADPARLQARQAEAGAQLAATPIPPGHTLAFEAVVARVPAAASRFVIEPLPPGRAPDGVH